MRWDRSRASENVEDRRGQSGGGGMRLGGRSIGLGTVAIAVVAMLFGVDPSVVLNMAGGLNPPAAKQQAAPPPPAEDEAARFVSHVLGDTEDTWRTIFAKSGKTYEEPKLVLFSGVRERLETQLMEPVPSTPAALRARMDAEIRLWSDVIKRGDIRIN